MHYSCLVFGHFQNVGATALDVGKTARVGNSIIGFREGRVGPVFVLLRTTAIHLCIRKGIRRGVDERVAGQANRSKVNMVLIEQYVH